MTVLCGTKRNNECNNDKCIKEFCNDYVEVYTGKDFDLEVLRNVADIYSIFSLRQIKSHCRKYDSLRYMMGICGHHAQFKGDLDDIYYLAGTVVLLQQHVFKECNVWEKSEGYKLIKRLHLNMDKKMKKDYRKAMKKYKAGKYK